MSAAPYARLSTSALLASRRVMAERRFVGHLDASTRIYQTSADAQLVRACASMCTYRDYLAKAHGFERGIERALGIAGIDCEGLVYAKSEAVNDDLLALGMKPQEIAMLPICDIGEPLDRLGQIVGWLFASMRAALGRGLALTELERAQPFARRHAARYLELAAHRRRSDRLADVIEDVGRDDSSSAIVIASAGNAFRTHRGWFLTPVPPRRSGSTYAPTPSQTGVPTVRDGGGGTERP